MHRASSSRRSSRTSPGGESQILRFVFWHSVILATLMELLTLLQATVLSWMVPGASGSAARTVPG